MTRFPPNVQQVTLERCRPRGIVWLHVRENETLLKFPLDASDCRHFAGLLLEAAETAPDRVVPDAAPSRATE